ncbi:MAG: hypothetical protein AMXMBFR7_50970 [Planctomycetota bacterium]
MSADWYYSTGGAQRGPITLDELKALIRVQTISRETLVWKEGMVSWEPAGQLLDLFTPPPPLPAAQPTRPAPPPLPTVTPSASVRRKSRLAFEEAPKPSGDRTIPKELPVKDPVPPALPEAARAGPNQPPKLPLPPLRSPLVDITIYLVSSAMAALTWLLNLYEWAIFFFVIMAVGAVFVAVKAAKFVRAAWLALPNRPANLDPKAAGWNLLVPIWNLYQVFPSINGLSTRTAISLQNQGSGAKAPVGISLALCIVSVTCTLLFLVVPYAWVRMAAATVPVALFGVWLILQRTAQLQLAGAGEVPSVESRLQERNWMLSVIAVGALATLLSLAGGVTGGAGSAGARTAPTDGQRCAVCGGRGICGVCRGYGRVQSEHRDPGGMQRYGRDTTVQCQTCGGSGKCTYCRGTGQANAR